VPGHRQLLGLDTKGGLFVWGALDKKPHRVVNLELTVTAINAVPGHAAASGAHASTGTWRVVSVDLERRKLQTVVTSSADFPFLNAKLSMDPEGRRLAVVWENEVRVFEGTTQVGRVMHEGLVVPRWWAGDELVLETSEGLRGWVPGATALAAPGPAAVHVRGDWELQVVGASLRVRHPRLGERAWSPQCEPDRRCLQQLEYGRPRWLGERDLLFVSDRLVALDLETLSTWVVVDGPDTELKALLDGRTLVVDAQASGRPKYVEVKRAETR
jgi:hypothetical protein